MFVINKNQLGGKSEKKSEVEETYMFMPYLGYRLGTQIKSLFHV